MKSVTKCVNLMIALTVANSSAHARPLVTEYTIKANWQAAVNNNYSTVDFTGFPEGTFITTQYSSLGVTFTDGNDSIGLTGSFIDDGAGLEGNNIIQVSFSAPISWIAADYPGELKIKLYNQGSLIYTSSNFGFGGVGFFAGLVLTNASFDAAVILKASGDDTSIDNLFFGPPIPGPGPLALLGIAALMPNWRRRRI